MADLNYTRSIAAIEADIDRTYAAIRSILDKGQAVGMDGKQLSRASLAQLNVQLEAFKAEWQQAKRKELTGSATKRPKIFGVVLS